jgi:hypothetical protein
MNQLAPPAGTSAPEGEQLGAMLIGLVQSLRNVQAISGERAAQLVADVKSDAWYPMSIFFGILDEVQEFGIDLGPILFQAGTAFIQDWFTQFDGHTVFPSAKDFILAQAQNGGYARVHRGTPDEIGWLELLDLNEPAGRATVVCVTPIPRSLNAAYSLTGCAWRGTWITCTSIPWKNPTITP